MDYTTQKLGFKIKKAVRYVRLYGVRRTLVKIKGQYHMKKRYELLPALPSTPPSGGHIGIIGCGNFSFSHIAFYLQKNLGNVIRGAMDIDVNKAASLFGTGPIFFHSSWVCLTVSTTLARSPSLSRASARSQSSSLWVLFAQYSHSCCS